MLRPQVVVLLLLVAGCADEPAPSAAAGASAAPTSQASPAPIAATASGTASASTSAAPTASADPDADPATSADAPPGKRYGCGAKGQPYCPMQGWMKRVMGVASANRDGPKLAQALEYTAKRPPPGMAGWTKMAREGAAKARKGDIDGAKGSCRTCHDAHKAAYRATLRDRPW
jgi:hypothetical protein